MEYDVPPPESGDKVDNRVDNRDADDREIRDKPRRDAISRAHKARGSAPSRTRHGVYINRETFAKLLADIGIGNSHGAIAKHFEVGTSAVYAAWNPKKPKPASSVLIAAVMREVRGLSSYQYETLFTEADPTTYTPEPAAA